MLNMNKSPLNPDSILVFYSCKNKKNKHDASGAFIPEAMEFQKVHSVPDNNMFAIDCINAKANKRKDQVLQLIHSTVIRKPISAIAFFGHGWSSGIQFGFYKTNIIELVDVLRSENASQYIKIILYSCLTAENDKVDNEIKKIGPATDGGFADCLRDELEVNNFKGWIDAHKTSGHTVYNPYVVRFYANENINDNYGGSWLVEPGSLYWIDWKNKLKTSDLRFLFPFETELNIKKYLDTF